MNPSLPLTRFSSAVVLTGLMLLPAALLPAASAQAGDSKAKAIGIAAAVEALPAGVRPPGRYALVIGADAYNDTRIPGLPACGNDARTLAAVLTDPQTGMVPKENLRLLVGADVTKEKVIDALDNLGRKAGRDDLVIVFFSGHGATDERGRAYWIMSGTKADMLRATALPETDVSELLGEIHATRLVTFIDACYSAATANVAQTKSLLDLSKLYPDFKGDGRVAITASKGDQLSMVISRKEDPGFGYSAFAWHLIEGLKGKADTQGLTGDNNSADGVVTVDELWAYVKDRTERTSRGMGGNQQPQIKGQLGSRFLLTVNSSRMLEIERDREARSQKVVERVAALRKLALDERISLTQFSQGKSLIEALPSELDEIQQKQRKVYEDLADGRIPPGYLSAGLEAIETPQQREARRTREAQAASQAAVATLTRQDKITLATLESIARDMAEASNDARVKTLATQYLELSSPLMRQHNNLSNVWAGRALAALAIEHVDAGWEAGQALLKMNADSVVALKALGELNRKGWLAADAHTTARSAAEILQAKQLFEALIATAKEVEADSGDRSIALATIAEAQADASLFDESRKTLGLAIAAKQGIGDTSFYGDGASFAILKAQVAAGQFDAAIATVQGIESEQYRAHAYNAIANAQAKSNQKDASIQSLNTAINTVKHINENYYQIKLFSDLAISQAEAGHIDASRQIFNAAIASVEGIDNKKGIKSECLGNYARLQAQTGQIDASRQTFDAAIASTKQILREHNRSGALGEIAVAQAEAGQKDASRQTFNLAIVEARSVYNEFLRGRTLADVASAQAKAGFIDAAFDTMQMVGDKGGYREHEAIAAIGIAQVKAGQFEAAILTAKKRDDIEGLINFVYAAIATKQAQAGQINSALTTLKKVEDKDEHMNRALAAIVTAQAQAGQVDAAIATALKIDNYDYDMIEALNAIVSAQVEAGQIDNALNTAQKIDNAQGHRINVLAVIAKNHANAASRNSVYVPSSLITASKQLEGGDISAASSTIAGIRKYLDKPVSPLLVGIEHAQWVAQLTQLETNLNNQGH